MVNAKYRNLYRLPGCLFGLSQLAGCPWGHMKYYPEETASAYMRGDSVCFYIPESAGYYPIYMSVNRRGILSEGGCFIEKPQTVILDGQLCIAPAIYKFPESSSTPFIIKTVLKSKNNRPRSFVMGFVIKHHQVYDIHLTEQEISRPYDQMDDK